MMTARKGKGETPPTVRVRVCFVTAEDLARHLKRAHPAEVGNAAAAACSLWAMGNPSCPFCLPFDVPAGVVGD